jgi:hypothetical protein
VPTFAERGCHVVSAMDFFHTVSRLFLLLLWVACSPCLVPPLRLSYGVYVAPFSVVGLPFTVFVDVMTKNFKKKFLNKF